MRKFFTPVLMFIIMIFGMASALPASAQDIQCDALINDTAGVFGSDTEAIEQAIDNLQDRGPVVRVLTVENFGNAGNLEQYVEHTVVPGCKSWQPANGNGFKNNLIVFAIAMDDGDGNGEVGIYYGEIWEDVLMDNELQEIQSHMGPRFADGDFVDGFVVGINEVENEIDRFQNPPVAIQQSQPSNPVVVEQSEPMDLSWLGPVLFSVVGLIAIAGATFGAVKLFTSVRKNIEERRTAAQGANIAESAALSLFTRYDRGVDDAKLLVESLTPNVSVEIIELLQHRLKEIEVQHDDVVSDYTNLGQPAGDPTNPKLSTAEYRAIEAGYREVNKRFQRAQTSLDQFMRSAEDMKNLVTEAPDLIIQASAAINKARHTIHDVSNEGYLVNQAVETLESASQTVDEAQDFLKQKELRKVADWTKQALITAAQAEQMAANRPILKSQANAATDDLVKSIAETNTLIGKGREVFDQISAEYAASSWQPIKGNGSESEALVKQAQALLDQAITLAETETQDWEGSLEATSQANVLLKRAQGHLSSIFTLKRNLAIAKQTAGQEIADAEMDVSKAQDFIVGHRDSVDRKHSARLRKAGQHLGEAKKELDKSKPDYLEVVRLAQLANNAADDILVDARSEYDALVRLQAKAKSTLSSAQIAVETADEYISDHMRHAGTSSVNNLSSAKQYLQSARQTSDLTKIIILADSAQSHADRAYQEAQASYRRHKQEEEQEERRRRSSYSSSSYGTGRNSGSSFGSSSSFGGGRMGGSSSSFGGGRMGGSSSKW